MSEVEEEELTSGTLDAARAVTEAMQELRRQVAASLGCDDVGEVAGSVLLDPSVAPEGLVLALRREAIAKRSLRAAFQGGRVYCYGCESATCEHSVAGKPEEVFAGYRNGGQPRWQAFHSFLLDIGDERVPDLWDDEGVVLTRVIGRKRLIADQFEACGRASSTYRVLGQVVAGYFRHEGAEFGLTVQLVETGDTDLHVQVLGAERLQELLTDADPAKGAVMHRSFDAVRTFRRLVRRHAVAWRDRGPKGTRSELRTKLFSGLRRLACSLERKGRQQGRRTDHAEVRSRNQRPVHKAMDDLRVARVEQIFLDDKTSNYVVLGKAGRAHVFAEDGRHVTSLVLPTDQLDRRVRRRRYGPAGLEALQSLQACARKEPTEGK